MEEKANRKEMNSTMFRLWGPALTLLKISEHEFVSLREIGLCLSTPMQKGDWKYNETVLGEEYHQENIVSEKPKTMIEVDTNIFSNKGLIIKTSNMPKLEGDVDENDLAFTLDHHSKLFIQAMSSNIVLHDLVLRFHDDLEIQTHILQPTWSWRVNNLPSDATEQIICFVITQKQKIS
jgi:hypothetical protein